MNREEKSQLLSELNELFSNSEVIVVSHYKGLTVKEVSELRDRIRTAGAGFRVTKNRITRLALKGTKFEGLADLFTGPTAIAFANDPISACKACVEFAKENEKLIVVGGAMGTGVISIDEIKKLASIPSMDELRAKIIGLLQAPVLSWLVWRRHTARRKPLNFIVLCSPRLLFFLLCTVLYASFKNNGMLGLRQ